MRGIVRPCRHSLDPGLYLQWRSHLCGTCLTLREEAGQASRVLTGYDVLLLSVLVEAQSGPAETAAAGRCPLRGMRTATVVAASSTGARLAAAAGLLAGAAALDDKVADGDLPAWAGRTTGSLAARAGRAGSRLAAHLDFDSDTFARASRAAAAAEMQGMTLEDFLAPSGAAVASMFAHTAVLARCPHNAEALSAMGDAFGRLVHLLDAVSDLEKDRRRGAFNPVGATGASVAQAHQMALSLTAEVASGLSQLDLVSPTLVRSLLGPVLSRSVERAFRVVHARPARPAASVAVAVASVPSLISLGMFGRRRRRIGYRDDYGPAGGGFCESCACCCCEEELCSGCCDCLSS